MTFYELTARLPDGKLFTHRDTQFYFRDPVDGKVIVWRQLPDGSPIKHRYQYNLGAYGGDLQRYQEWVAEDILRAG